MTDQSLREAVARAICAADPMAPDPDANIMLGMRTAKAWEARLPMADAAMLALGGKPVTRDREADARAVAIAGGMIAASAMLCLTEQEIRLACGEVTAQEMRTVKAVLEWRRAAIVSKAEEL